MTVLDSEPMVSGTASASGSGAFAFTVGRDFVVGETHVHAGAEEFVLHDPENYPPEDAPRSAPALAARVRLQRVLVLAGTCEDKPLVARHVAARLVRDAANQPPELLEWAGDSDLGSLLRGLRRRTAPAVVMLPRIEPRDVDWRLSRLRDEAVALGHFVVATTDLPAAMWHLGVEDEGFWHELVDEDLFETAQLVTALIGALERVKGALPPGLLVDDAASAGATRLGGATLHAVARQLRTPATVSMFVSLLVQRASTGPVDPGVLRRLLNEVTSPLRPVEKWFGTEEPDRQFLALGLSLFEGLADDQFFAALERWVAHIRKHRDPGLRAFDYCDVVRLQQFFQEVKTEGAAMRYEPRWPGQRRVVFGAAWQTHRRQLMGALSLLTDLVVESADDGTNDVELYGSPARRRQLRKAAMEALSDVGLLSTEAVHPALVRLASHEHLEVQEVAAAAAALWRGNERDEAFFALLKRWQRDARIGEQMEAWLTGRDPKRNFGPQAQIRSTIALAIAVAAGYDRPGRLRPELVALFEELANDSNRLVRERFSSYTLPQVVSRHLAQLRELLHRLAANVALTRAIGAALAYASRTVPDEVAATLNAWHAECAASRPPTFDPRRVTARDARLMVLAYTYGELPYDEGAPLTAEAGFARLKEMLAREAHPEVRSAVVIAIGLQASQRFTWVEPMLQTLVGEVTPDERDKVVRLLTGVYLAQREELGPADGEFKHGEARYPIWIEKVRPLTAVEAAMIRWLGDTRHPAAQRIAVQATLSFAETLDGPEADEVTRRRRRRQQQAETDAAARIAGTPLRVAAQAGWYTGTFVPWLATLGEPALFPVVRTLLPEALAQRTVRPQVLGFVLGRWERMIGYEDTPRIARRLRSALGWQSGAGCLLALAAFVFLWLLAKIL